MEKQLLETENDSLDSHVSGGFRSVNERMEAHIEDKAKYLKKYAELLREFCNDDAGIGVFNGIIDEIRDITLELRRSLQGSLVDNDPTVNPRLWINAYSNDRVPVLMDLINRLQRIQRVLNTSYMTMKKNDN